MESSIIGGPFDTTIGQRAVNVYVFRRRDRSEDELNKYDSCLILMENASKKIASSHESMPADCDGKQRGWCLR